MTYSRSAVALSAAMLLVLPLCGPSFAAVVWPTSDSSWTAFQTGDPATDYYDPSGPSPNSIDVIGLSSGGTSYAAAFWYDDTVNDNLFFRIRLNGDPTSQGGYDNYTWQILLNTDSDDDVEWALMLVASGGGSDTLGLHQASVGGTTWGAVTLASNPVWSTTDLSTYTRATDLNANIDTSDNKDDWFLDFAVPYFNFYGVTGVKPGGNFRAAVSTSSTHTDVNKDLPAAWGDSDSVSNGWTNTLTTSLNHSPEPGTLALFGLGGLAGSWYLRRRKRKGAAAGRAP